MTADLGVKKVPGVQQKKPGPNLWDSGERIGFCGNYAE